MTWEKRWSNAIREAGGALMLLTFPKWIKDALMKTGDLPTKVQILERYNQIKKGC